MSERNSSFRIHPGVAMASDPTNVTVPILIGPRQAHGIEPGPACFVANRPRSGIAWGTKYLPAEPPKAKSIVELRDWASRDLNWLVLSRWSRGITALDRPIKQRVERKATEDMSVSELASSQGDELPTISDLAWEELGTKALSMDLAASGSDDDEEDLGTIGSQIPQPTREALGFVGQPAEDDITPELEAALDALRLRLAHRYSRFGTPLSLIAPNVRDRMEWEQYVARCSSVSSEGFVLEPNAVRYTHWPRIKHPVERQERQAAYTAAWLAERGLDAIPPLAAWKERHAKYLDREQTERPVARLAWLDAERLFAELDKRPWVDYDGGASATILDTDYVPSLDLLQIHHWKAYAPNHWVPKPEYAALRAQARAAAYTEWRALNKAAKTTVKHVCRNTRTHGSKDEPWHAEGRDPEEFVIGWTQGGFPYATRRLPAREWMKRATPMARTRVTLTQRVALLAKANEILRIYEAGSQQAAIAADEWLASRRHRAGSGVAG